MDDTTAITVLYNGMLTIPPVDGTVSIFAHSARATGVTLTNLRYPLTNATLTYTRPLGISNEMLGLPASISVSRGSLVVVFPVQAIDHVIRHMNTKK
ncbi:hypothetical protein AGMMS49992_09380 [Clostridia bacterium]|nr:hypothetical protein AGMMS49992_09380 [Clostridia bacterium]